MGGDVVCCSVGGGVVCWGGGVLCCGVGSGVVRCGR